jgi:hypothetical protein
MKFDLIAKWRGWTMTQNEIRVGIVGAGAEKIWAKVSHVPAIRGLAGLRLAPVALVLLFAAPRVRAEVAHAPLNLPDAPLANLPQTSAQTDASAATGQSGSQTSPAPSKAPPLTPEEQRKKAQEQLEQEEHQRVCAVVATFNTTANQQAIPLSTGQKFQLFFKSAMDPWPFLLAAVLAGTNQAQNSFPEYGQGVQGTPSDLAPLTGTTSSAISWVTLYWPACCAKIRATSRRARAVTPGVLFGQQPAPCGASEITVPGDRIMQTSWAICRAPRSPTFSTRQRIERSAVRSRGDCQ